MKSMENDEQTQVSVAKSLFAVENKFFRVFFFFLALAGVSEALAM